MRIACWKPKATSAHSEYVILIFFPLQQWLHERTMAQPSQRPATTYVKPEAVITVFELLMMGGVSSETC